ncbi:hypothetical protein [Buttiauxella izardii]|uniref:Uncharacterized protein n=1 Tax=Buttiauxella izardii TaxID=82991 RepID=A0A3A5JRS1_9ENTR|nr:hypothetical protein [Buttiauxella izardii]RJT17425.1 hypothetical protein D6029_22120 [Buttiauxella izardii]
MKKYLPIMLFLFFYSGVSEANCTHRTLRCINTSLGLLEQKTLSESNDGYSHLSLNGKEIYKAKASYIVVGYDEDGIFKDKKYYLTKATVSYTSDDPCYPDKPGAHCGMNAILDLTSGRPIISNGFFSEFGESKITWVSWGKANSIIVIDDELRFKYSNGHVERVTNAKDSMTDNKAKE